MKKNGNQWRAFDFGSDSNPTCATNPLKKNKGKSSKHSGKAELPIAIKRGFDFHFHLAPKSVQDLAVHPKKIKQVEYWLQANVKTCSKKHGTAAFLLITGPTGSGKSATLRVLCASMGISITEWRNPIDQDFEYTRGQNQVERFVEFLSESKWGSLLASVVETDKVVLVEEFPNALVRNPEEFLDILEDCQYKSNYKIVFICTDSFDNGINISQKLFPQDLCDKYNITNISFNPCAATLMKNALRRAHNLVQSNPDLFQTPSQAAMDAIIATSLGDIRCATNQYHLASLPGSAELPVSPSGDTGQRRTSKRKRGGATAKTASTVAGLPTRDENLGLFHSLGRVLNPKRIENVNGDGSWRLNCDVSKLIEEFCTQPGVYTSFLFENYVKYFGDITDACRAANALSLSQVFLEKWVDRHDTLIFAMWIAVLGLMIHNEHKVSKWTPIRGPVKVKKRVSPADLETRDLAVTDLFYYNVIRKNKTSQFRRKL